MTQTPVYLDHNATTPIDKEVAEAMLPYLTEHFGNPSSAHAFGQTTRQAVDKARSQLAALLNCTPDELTFTGSATESNNMVIKGLGEVYTDRARHIITSSVEHASISESCDFLEKQGYQITYLPVDGYERVNIDDVAPALTDETLLVSVMVANNEVGTIQPIAEIAALTHEHGALMHADAAQAIGKIPVDVHTLGVDMLTVAGHKLYGPKGIGALYVREGLHVPKFMHGAPQESNRRAGTENVLLIVGLGQAAEIAMRDIGRNADHMAAMRDRLAEKMQGAVTDIQINGHPEHRLPNTLSISFRNLEANVLVDSLAEEVAVSAGAACHSDQVTVSEVLEAMHVPLEYAMGTLRFSTGKHNTESEIDYAVDKITALVMSLRGVTQ